MPIPCVYSSKRKNYYQHTKKIRTPYYDISQDIKHECYKISQVKSKQQLWYAKNVKKKYTLCTNPVTKPNPVLNWTEKKNVVHSILQDISMWHNIKKSLDRKFQMISIRWSLSNNCSFPGVSRDWIEVYVVKLDEEWKKCKRCGSLDINELKEW